MAELTDEHRAMLDFERRPWRHAGAKAMAVDDLFGMSLSRYQAELSSVLDEPDALDHAPATVRRLRRQRQRRLAARRESRASA